jgi:hypothetical protein
MIRIYDKNQWKCKKDTINRVSVDGEEFSQPTNLINSPNPTSPTNLSKPNQLTTPINQPHHNRCSLSYEGVS